MFSTGEKEKTEKNNSHFRMKKPLNLGPSFSGVISSYIGGGTVCVKGMNSWFIGKKS